MIRSLPPKEKKNFRILEKSLFQKKGEKLKENTFNFIQNMIAHFRKKKEIVVHPATTPKKFMSSF
jgi:hypothetical protein